MTSKSENEECYKMVLPAEVFETDNDVEVMDKIKSMLETPSGTKIKLSGFKRERWKDISINELKSEIEDHFEGLLIRKNLEMFNHSLPSSRLKFCVESKFEVDSYQI